MRLPLALSALLFATAAAPVALADPPAPLTLALEQFTLDNGLQVILHEDHRTPVVAVNIWYHVGSKDEPQGKNGFAHLFEHLMFQGSKNVAEDMFFKYLERAGASDTNGTTSQDRTNYYETIPANELATALWLESDRMGFLLDHVDQKTFESQREVVKNERRQNYENAPYGLVGQFISAALYPQGHPYHLLTIGTPHDLDAATLDDVRAFFKTFYVPNNATLVIAGDLDPAQTKALVTKYFAPIARGAAPPVATKPIAVTLAKEARLEVEAEVELARVFVTWPTPAFYAPGDAELDIAASVLSDGKSSRLYKRLVQDLQIAQDVSASQSSHLLGGQFEILATVKKGKDPAEVLKIIDDEIDKLKKKEPTVDELRRAQTRFRSGKIFRAEGVGAQADLVNEYVHFAHDANYFSQDMTRHDHVAAAGVKSAASQWLPAGARVVAVVTPTPGAPRAGRLRGAP